MDTIISALGMLANFQVLIALLVGSIGGVIIGAIPGVGPPIAIAIILPASFSMEPLVGLTMMLGVYGAGMYGGAIPAVLINLPGTAVNGLTTYDGYPITKSGQPDRAISLAFGASFFGAIFGICCLIILAPAMVLLAPLFGAREIFLAALLGIVLVVTAHSGQIMAAGMMAGLGIFIGTVGLDRTTYSKRFTFDQSWLSSGFDLIVVVVGLFAFSQAFILLSEPENRPKLGKFKVRVMKHLKDVLGYKRVATVSSGFGVLMGIIPGVGEFTAQFFAYTYAKRTSKEPQKFGNGAPEGLVASEAANNAVPAAALIPLLALGVPGEALTAMMLSVFYVHNVLPGPTLFEQHLDFVYALYFSLILINVMVLVFLIFSTRWLVRVVEVPTRFLGVIVLCLAFVGVYSLRNSITDCMIAAAFGLLGLILKRLNLSAVPIILGMVLGGIMEVKLRNATARIESPIDMIATPISAVLFLAIVVIIATSLFNGLRSKAHETSEVFQEYP